MIRYPAEWEPQRRTWLAWPHNQKNWGQRPGIVDFYVELIGLIRKFQPAALLVPPDAVSKLPAALKQKAPHPLEIFSIPTDDIWIRDYGPLFVEKDGTPQIVSFEFNAWGKKFPPWDADNRVPEQIAEALGLCAATCRAIFEGGAIEIDGRGHGLTTLDCLTGANRNKKEALPEVEKEIKDALGLSSLTVLPKGLFKDHTDGHIDNVARFVAPNHVVAAAESDSASPNYEILKDAKKRLLALRSDGAPLTVSTLPLPGQRALGDEVLPASYMNFIYVNGGVIVPLYNSPHDAAALDFFKKVHPDRKISGIDCTLVIEEGGSLHCLTRQEPLFAESTADSRK
jgi:agmatine deiminase